MFPVLHLTQEPQETEGNACAAHKIAGIRAEKPASILPSSMVATDGPWGFFRAKVLCWVYIVLMQRYGGRWSEGEFTPKPSLVISLEKSETLAAIGLHTHMSGVGWTWGGLFLVWSLHSSSLPENVTLKEVLPFQRRPLFSGKQVSSERTMEIQIERSLARIS